MNASTLKAAVELRQAEEHSLDAGQCHADSGALENAAAQACSRSWAQSIPSPLTVGLASHAHGTLNDFRNTT